MQDPALIKMNVMNNLNKIFLKRIDLNNLFLNKTDSRAKSSKIQTSVHINHRVKVSFSVETDAKSAKGQIKTIA